MYLNFLTLELAKPVLCSCSCLWGLQKHYNNETSPKDTQTNFQAEKKRIDHQLNIILQVSTQFAVLGIRFQHLQRILITLMNFNVVNISSSNYSCILKRQKSVALQQKETSSEMILLQRKGRVRSILASFLRPNTIPIRWSILVYVLSCIEQLIRYISNENNTCNNEKGPKTDHLVAREFDHRSTPSIC